MGRFTTQMFREAPAGRGAIAAASLSISILAMAVLTGAAQAATHTFSFTGAEQTFTVPSGVTSVQVDATGASGAAGDPAFAAAAAGGSGAHVSATLDVTPGQTLYVEVGGVGQCNGAGPSGALTVAGSGGGAADVRTVSVGSAFCAVQDPASLQSRLIVAAGGGGGGYAADGNHPGQAGAGGAAGEPGPAVASANGGEPGTDTAGGAPNGSLGQGGPGTAITRSSGVLVASSGGGGGGLFGGGGGRTLTPAGSTYVATGGGGGSSLVPAGGSLGAASGPAQVSISPIGDDRVAPQISISSPRGSYGLLHAILNPPRAQFSCTDDVGGSGLASCAATADGRPVAHGGSVPTGLGHHTFTVTATDQAGNVSTQTRSYTIGLL